MTTSKESSARVSENEHYLRFSRTIENSSYSSSPVDVERSTAPATSMSAPDHSPNNLAREDVHKSCRSLETVVNLLNGYCEAAGTVVILQKKLVKAIRDTASMKASPTVASNYLLCRSFALSSPHPGADNTLNAAATIFETISEVDGKFIKLADKECDSVNNDVKKWFRKLAVSSANSPLPSGS